MKKTLYLDSNASSPLDPLVKDAILEELDFSLANPSSPHQSGQAARGRLDRYRRVVATYFKVKPQEVIFTSSGTEALNFLVQSALKRRPGKVLTSDREHSAVYEQLKNHPDTLMLKGDITCDAVRPFLHDNLSCIVLMAANNETGIRTDIEGIAALADQFKIPFIVDGVALLGKEKVVIPKGVSGMAFSGHKIHSPPGVGCAIVKAPFKAFPFIVGGAQEYGLRGGTESLLNIRAFSKALELISADPAPYLNNLRRQFEEKLLTRQPTLVVNGKSFSRISNVSNIFFPDSDGETLLMRLDQLGLACSLGSACTSGALEPSRVLLSMGLSYKEAKSSIRFSFSRMNTLEEIEQAVELISSVYESGSF